MIAAREHVLFSWRNKNLLKISGSDITRVQATDPRDSSGCGPDWSLAREGDDSEAGFKITIAGGVSE